MIENIGFFDKTRLLETVESYEPSPQLVRTVHEAMTKNRSLLQAFVRIAKNPAWVSALHKDGFFASPPAARRVGDHIEYDVWPAGRLLVRLAPSIPEVVQAVIEEVTTDNFRVYLNILDAALTLDSTCLAGVWFKLLEQFSTFAQHILVLDKLCELGRKLVKHDHTSEALSFVSIVLEPLPPVPEDSPSFKMHTDACGLFLYDKLDRAVSPLIQDLASREPQRTLVLLEEKFVRTLELEQAVTGVDFLESTYWRSTIEPTDQNILKRHRDYLLDSLRDALETFVRVVPSQTRAVLVRYLTGDKVILQRLGLHLLRICEGKHVDLVAEQLRKSDALDDVDLHHEVFLLLRDRFTDLPSSEQAQVLTLIKSGPTDERLTASATWVKEGVDDARPENELREQCRDHWIRERLLMIKGVLTPEHLAYLAALSRRLGERRGMPPEFTHYVGPTVWGSKSPISGHDLSSMSANAVIDYLLAWQPDPNATRGARPSAEGLGNELQGDLARRWDEYLPELSRLLAARSFPVYATTVLRSVCDRARRRRDAIRGNRPPEVPPFLWQSVIPLVTQAISTWSSPREEGESLEVGYARSVRLVALDVIGEAVNDLHATNEQSDVPFLCSIRQLLLALCQDPDPNQEEDAPPEGYAGHNDPMTVAVNHVRPKALRVLIHYACARARNLQLTETDRWEPSVRALVTQMLSDSATSVRSVYGQYWRHLYSLDENWARSHHERIFTQVPNQERHLRAAWDSYVVFSHVGHYDYNLMRPLYAAAVTRACEGKTTATHLDPVSSLAAHLCAIYCNDIEVLPSSVPETHSDNPLARLYSFRPHRIHSSFAQHLWQLGDSSEEVPVQYWSKARELWTYRLTFKTSYSGEDEYADELAWFIHWLSLPALHLVPKDMKPLLSESIGPLGLANAPHALGILIKYLAKQARQSPDVCIDLLSQLFREHGAEWDFDRERMIAILEAAADSTPECRDQAIQIIHLLGEYGHYWARELLDRLRARRE